nr:DUF308 domain-containing protein [uncultured Ruminococcus sp.]
MSSGQRIKNILIGIAIILGALILIAFPEEGIIITASILSLSLFIYGIKTLIYYITMARHMVGGRIMLYIAVVVLDLGMFTMMLTNIPKIYIALYLLVVYAFAGVVGILRALEAKRYQAPMWKLSLVSGVVNVIIAILCIIFMGSTKMIVYLYCAGLIYSAIVRIVTAFRETAIVYIQ